MTLQETFDLLWIFTLFENCIFWSNCIFNQSTLGIGLSGVWLVRI